jgi:hypothetical protein
MSDEWKYSKDVKRGVEVGVEDILKDGMKKIKGAKIQTKPSNVLNYATIRKTNRVPEPMLLSDAEVNRVFNVENGGLKKVKRVKYTGPLSKYGWPNKVVSVSHGSIVVGILLDNLKNVHIITVAENGDLNNGKLQRVQGSYASVVEKAKKMALQMGENTALMTHGASENFIEYQVRNRRLVKV